MEYIYAILIGGAICALAQLLTELKVPFNAVAILFMVIGGGLFTKLGIYDWLCSLGAGGANVTAMGGGNGAFSAAVALVNTGNAASLILGALVNIILVAMGAACGTILVKKLPE